MNRPLLIRIVLLVGLLAAVLIAGRIGWNRTGSRPAERATESIEEPAAEETVTPAVPSPTPTAVPDRLEVWPDETYALDAFPPDVPLVIHFNQPMDTRYPRPLLFTPPIQGAFTWDESQTTLTFTPNNPFTPGRSYVVTVNAALASAGGEHFPSLQRWRMRVQTTPAVSRREPAAARIADRQPAIRVRFNRPMDRASVITALRIEPPLDYETHWDGEELIVELQEPLHFGVRYRFTIAKTAADRQGMPMVEDAQWHYQLHDAVAEVSGPTAQDPLAPLVVRFNYPLARVGAAGLLRITPPIDGDFDWNEDITELTLTPDGRWPTETEYTLTFNQPLYDRDGNELPLPAPLRFTTPPAVLSATPGDSNAHPAARIAVRFDRPMEPATTEAAFNITPAVAGRFEWEETTLIFRPETGYFEEHTEYTVTIAPTATSSDGQRVLRDPYTWSFATGEMTELASFGSGPRAQVLNIAGRRAIQLQALTTMPVILNFELYRLSLAQFLEQYTVLAPAGSEEEIPVNADSLALIARWQTETSRPAQEHGNVQETTVPGEVPPGLYLLNMTAGRLNDQLLLVLTQNTLVVKEAEGQLLAWVTQMNGNVAPNVPVRAYGRDGRLLGSGQSDARGLFRTTLPVAAAQPGAEPLLVVAGAGHDLTFSGLGPWRSSDWGPQGRSRPGSSHYSAYIYTDRPIYRPGQQVFFKVVLRRDDDAVLSLPPAGTAVTVRLRDARNNVVQSVELATGDAGSVDGAFELAQGAMLGTYHVEIVVDGEFQSQSLRVEAYRRPDYEVTVSAGDAAYVAGDAIEVIVDTRYFFGEPVANAEVQIRRYRQETFLSPFGQSDPGWYETGDTTIFGRTDAGGRFTTTIATAGKLESEPGQDEGALIRETWSLEATVNDGSNQSASGFAVVTVYSAAEAIHLERGSAVQEPGRPFTVTAQVRTTLGDRPVAGRRLTLEVRRLNHSGQGTVVESVELATGDDGRVSTPLTLDETGYYQLRAGGQDSRGQAIAVTSWLYVSGDRPDGWSGRQGSNLSIAAGRDTYAPGETAQLFIESPFGGPALLTFERGKIRRQQLVTLTPPLTIVEAPIETTDAPNVHVTINAWQEQDTTLRENVYSSLADSRLHSASVNLSVPVTDKRLQVTITPDREAYAPGDQATLTVRVNDEAGEPVAAEVFLALVDEAVFSLSGELAGPIFDAFYAERANRVHTYDSLALQRYLGGGIGGGGGNGTLPGSSLRRDFQDTAAWFPTLQTDANGKARVTVTLPDNVTAWRATAKAATADTEVGEGTRTILVQKEIVIRPILPRSLTAGDSVQLAALVHNHSARPQALDIQLTIDNWQLAIDNPHDNRALLTIHSPTAQTITQAPNESQVISWSVEAAAAGEVEITLSAAPTSPAIEGDAVRLTLPIRPLALPDVTTQVSQINGRYQTTLFMPDDAYPTSSVDVHLTRSVAGSLLGGLEYLVEFPYGSVEQTASKTLTNAVIGRVLQQLGVSDAVLAAELPSRINTGLQQLYALQHVEGSWGWWYDDAGRPYQTAWALFSLATTAEAGYEVDTEVIRRGASWLNGQLGRMDPRARAFALYTLEVAGHSNPVATSELAGQVEELDTFGRAALALALQQQGQTARAQAIVDLLAETAGILDDGRVYWPDDSEDDSYRRRTMASATRNTALALSALSHIQPGHDLGEGAVNWLMSQRRSQGWGHTNETAFAILGLADHLLATGAAGDAGDNAFIVQVNGVEVAGGILSRSQPATSLTIPYESLQPGANELVITQDGPGPLYAVVNTRAYVPRGEIEAAGPIRVTRTYVDPTAGQPLDTIAAGQLVRVNVNVLTSQSASYVVVEDRLPGGLEALNEGFNTTSHAARATAGPQHRWQEYGYNHKELFGDRVSFFITELGSGNHTFSYYARATHAGDFMAMPAGVSAMVDRTFWGQSAGGRIVINGQ